MEMEGEEFEEGNVDGLRLVVKLAFFVYLLGQDGNSQRLVLLSIGAVIIFLAQMGWLSFFNRFAVPHGPAARPAAPPPLQPQPPDADGPAAEAHDAANDAPEQGADGGAAALGPHQVPVEETRIVAIYRDVESVVHAFFASLLPTYRTHDANVDFDEAVEAMGAM